MPFRNKRRKCSATLDSCSSVIAYDEVSGYNDDDVEYLNDYGDDDVSNGGADELDDGADDGEGEAEAVLHTEIMSVSGKESLMQLLKQKRGTGKPL